MSIPPDLQQVIHFLQSIGLEVEIHQRVTGFIDGVRIEHGRLLVDRTCRISGLIHEAGHLAIVPSRYRNLMNDNLAVGVRAMFKDLEAQNLEPDHPLVRAAIQCSDPEVTAWSWAAGVHLGLRPHQIIQDDEYDNTGTEIRLMLQANQYVGIHGLAHAGMCKRGRWLAREVQYPTMTHWLQPA